MKESRQGFCRREKGRSFHVEGPKTEKDWESTVESLLLRNPETDTESMRRRTECTGGSVNLNTVTEIRRSSAQRYIYSREYSVSLAQNSLWDWEPAS